MRNNIIKLAVLSLVLAMFLTLNRVFQDIPFLSVGLLVGASISALFIIILLFIFTFSNMQDD